MKSSWSGEYPNTSYNNWLREEAVASNNMLSQNMAKLQAQLQALGSVICLEEITMERSARVSQALIHAMTEIHLLVTLTLEKER